MNARLFLILAAGMILAGCGKTGELERPAPMFSKAAPPTPEEKPQDPSRPVETIDPREGVRPSGTNVLP